MDQKVANKLISTLESVATEVDQLAKAGKLDSEFASKVSSQIDAYADRLEIAAFGKESFLKRRAKVLEMDSDEPYMKTFENPQEPLQTDPDEPYMHESGASFNGKSIKTYDSDDTSQVSERDEYNVRDLSEWSDKTKPQPSWPRGSAGNSTKQGSTKSWA